MQNKGFIFQLPYQTLTRPYLCNLYIYHLRHFFPSDNGLLFKSIVKKHQSIRGSCLCSVIGDGILGDESLDVFAVNSNGQVLCINSILNYVLVHSFRKIYYTI
ncbi:hypothetical protein Hanom_Chr07g00593971 [Helianthus anomalus]